MERNQFPYADKEEQIRRVNWLSKIVYTVYAIFCEAIVIIAMLQGIRTMGYTIGCAGVMLITAAIPYVLAAIPRTQRKVWVGINVGYVLSGMLMLYAFDSYYLRFAVLAPLAVFILYYDFKIMLVSSIAMGVMQVLMLWAKLSDGTIADDSMSHIMAVCVVLFFLFVVNLLTNLGRAFQEHMLGSLKQEQEQQALMMQDVIQVAAQVREGTEGAMGIMNELNESTGVVSGAVRNISDSTQATAQNIENQTIMTQNIQESIENTLSYSDNMVKLAGKTNEINQANMAIMTDVQSQSVAIEETNAQVVATMEELKERTNAVKGIAETIFAISSQTNLLALNASIESARAGEAGRGFAVVADEIRGLAERTRVETESINSILKELAEKADQAAETVSKSVSATKEQDAMIAQAAASMEEMSSSFNDLSDNIHQIDDMLSSLSAANNQIVDNIMQLSAATQEVTASSAQAEDLSTQNLTNADNTKELLDQVLEIAQQLDKYVGQ